MGRAVAAPRAAATNLACSNYPSHRLNWNRKKSIVFLSSFYLYHLSLVNCLPPYANASASEAPPTISFRGWVWYLDILVNPNHLSRAFDRRVRLALGVARLHHGPNIGPPRNHCPHYLRHRPCANRCQACSGCTWLLEGFRRQRAAVFALPRPAITNLSLDADDRLRRHRIPKFSYRAGYSGRPHQKASEIQFSFADMAPAKRNHKYGFGGQRISSRVERTLNDSVSNVAV